MTSGLRFLQDINTKRRHGVHPGTKARQMLLTTSMSDELVETTSDFVNVSEGDRKTGTWKITRLGKSLGMVLNPICSLAHITGTHVKACMCELVCSM